MKTIILLYFLIILCCINAQQSINYKLTCSVFDQGGVTSFSNNFKLTSSTGQPVQSLFSSGNSFILNSGFINNSLITTSVKEDTEEPEEFKLNQNYPNPFNPTTIIQYQLPFDSKVLLEIYSIIGEKLFILVDTEQTAGHYNIKFDGNALGSGIFLYRLTVSEIKGKQQYTQTNKMILIK